MAILIEVTIAGFVVIGGAFVFIGSLGLAKLPDTMRRLHGPTKATTLGIGALLVASILYFALLEHTGGIHEVLITMFLFLTAPVSCNMIAKAHLFRDKQEQRTLPRASGRQDWATFYESQTGGRKRPRT